MKVVVKTKTVRMRGIGAFVATIYRGGRKISEHTLRGNGVGSKSAYDKACATVRRWIFKTMEDGDTFEDRSLGGLFS